MNNYFENIKAKSAALLYLQDLHNITVFFSNNLINNTKDIASELFSFDSAIRFCFNNNLVTNVAQNLFSSKNSEVYIFNSKLIDIFLEWKSNSQGLIYCVESKLFFSKLIIQEINLENNNIFMIYGYFSSIFFYDTVFKNVHAKESISLLNFYKCNITMNKLYAENYQNAFLLMQNSDYLLMNSSYFIQSFDVSNFSVVSLKQIFSTIFVENFKKINIFNCHFKGNAIPQQNTYSAGLNLISSTKSIFNISNSIFEKNKGYNGGSLTIKGSNGTISSCIFLNNSAYTGAGIYFNGSG